MTKLGLFFALVVVYTLFSFYLGLFQAGHAGLEGCTEDGRAGTALQLPRHARVYIVIDGVYGVISWRLYCTWSMPWVLVSLL